MDCAAIQKRILSTMSRSDRATMKDVEKLSARLGMSLEEVSRRILRVMPYLIYRLDVYNGTLMYILEENLDTCTMQYSMNVVKNPAVKFSRGKCTHVDLQCVATRPEFYCILGGSKTSSISRRYSDGAFATFPDTLAWHLLYIWAVLGKRWSFSHRVDADAKSRLNLIPQAEHRLVQLRRLLLRPLVRARVRIAQRKQAKPAVVPKSCASCSRESSDTKFKLCGGCKEVRYCSRDCQVAHWPLHRDTCKGHGK